MTPCKTLPFLYSVLRYIFLIHLAIALTNLSRGLFWRFLIWPFQMNFSCNFKVLKQLDTLKVNASCLCLAFFSWHNKRWKHWSYKWQINDNIKNDKFQFLIPGTWIPNCISCFNIFFEDVFLVVFHACR